MVCEQAPFQGSWAKRKSENGGSHARLKKTLLRSLITCDFDHVTFSFFFIELLSFIKDTKNLISLHEIQLILQQNQGHSFWFVLKENRFNLLLVLRKFDRVNKSRQTRQLLLLQFSTLFTFILSFFNFLFIFLHVTICKRL